MCVSLRVHLSVCVCVPYECLYECASVRVYVCLRPISRFTSFCETDLRGQFSDFPRKARIECEVPYERQSDAHCFILLPLFLSKYVGSSRAKVKY